MRALILSFMLLISFFGYGQDRFMSQQWVDSVMANMSLRQRIAQLFVVSMSIQDKAKDSPNDVLNLVQKEQIGGVILMKGTPNAWALAANCLQKASIIPLLMTIDAEHGVGMRMDSVQPFPRQMTQGAIVDSRLTYEMGAAIARQCKRLGFQMNFSPVADINNNSANPVINVRSFGESREKVADKAIAYMQGLQYNGIIACAKHFPGHGDTDVDSHNSLPLIPYSLERIDSLELYPFRKLMAAGIAAVMIGHLEVPAWDTSSRPSSLSSQVVTSLLKETMDYDGLIVTDALNMHGVSQYCQPELIPLHALQAGNDIILMPSVVSEAIDSIENAVLEGRLDEHSINMKCRKMLRTKFLAGLQVAPVIETAGLIDDLNNMEDEALRYRMAGAALTVVRNEQNILPLQNLESMRIACVEVGKGKGTEFTESLNLYASVNTFHIDRMPSSADMDSLAQALESYNLIIVGYHDADARPQYNFGVDSVFAEFLTSIAKEKQVILTFFGIPYGVQKFYEYQNFQAIVLAYENRKYMKERAAQLIFGAIPSLGNLPVSANSTLPVGSGINWDYPNMRLRYVLPEEIGISSKRLLAVDSLMMRALKAEATPGGQIVAAYKGQVFYRKSFGNHTFDTSSVRVKDDDIYDLASLTKVNATLPVIMHLTQKGALNVKDELGKYLHFGSKESNKNSLKIENILTHQSGLRAFEPFHTRFLIKAETGGEKRKLLDTALFSKEVSEKFPIQVADCLYASEKVPQLMWKEINESSLLSKVYRYSDWGFMYMQRVAESVLHSPLNLLADSLFYAPLGMSNTSFLPLQKYAKGRIPPTEIDVEYRQQLVKGYVHDHNAGFLGGVSGHAGLFSNANDVAKLMQLYLNRGTYGGRRYFDASLVDEFTASRFYSTNGSRRGLGFDKPEPNEQISSPVERVMSLESYGHLGYTGTICWVDPVRDLVFVMLTNRTYPSDGKKLVQMNVRSVVLAEFVKIIDELKGKGLR